MVLLIAALVIGLLLLIWLWKGPVAKVVAALKKGGSNTFEAYFIIILVVGGFAASVYMIWEVL